MIALILSGLISLILFLITGIAFTKLLKFSNNFTEKILLGLVVSNTITSFLSIFFAININVLAILLLGCFFLLFYIKNEIFQFFSLLNNKRNIFFAGLPFIFIALLISVGPPLNWDTGLYHLQSIKWIEEYAVVPGLANLHGRFGFNPNIFTVFSLTSMSRIFGQEIFSLNFLLFSVFVLHFVNKLYLIFKEESISNYFIFNLLIFVTILNLSDNLSSPSPDFISLAFPLFIFSRITKTYSVSDRLNAKCYPTILILSLYIITVKLATLPMLLLAILLYLKHRSNRIKLLILIPLLTLILVPWLVRNIVLSGWLIYPFPLIDLFNFDWKVQLAQVQLEKLLITGFARSHGQQNSAAYYMNIFEWFPMWWHGLTRNYKIIFLAATSFPIFLFTQNLFKKEKMNFDTLVIVITSFIGVLFWFVLAPDFRFGKGFLVIAALTPLLYYQFKIHVYWEPNFKKMLPFLLLMVTLTFYFAATNTGLNVIRIEKQNVGRVITPEVINVPDNIKFRSYEIGKVEIFVPTTEDRCFNHPLPCTGYSDTTLELRGKYIQDGFKNGKPKM